MNPLPDPGEERLALRLSMRDWLVVALLSTALIAIAPSIRFRPRTPVIERDYRIPYALSARWEVYRRLTALSSAQFPTILVGDSVIWGQCVRKDQTLAHHLNELTKQPRFANAGLDGMHPIALVQLLQHHAPGIQRKDVILHFDPLWLMQTDDYVPPTVREALFNRPDLMPRLAAEMSTSLKQGIHAAAASLVRRSPLAGWADRFWDTRVDFLAWSLDHPYESPLRAISSALPPSEDRRPLIDQPWDGAPASMLDCGWPVLDQHPQWRAFEQILSLLELRGNRVLVLVGPMNEWMMRPATKERYQTLKTSIRDRLDALGIACFIASPLPSREYADICHPLGAGYEELARELLKSESTWLLGSGQPR